MNTLKHYAVSALLAILGLGTTGCGPDTRQNVGTVRVTGSDTMVSLAQAWSEKFQESHPDISVPVKGGGSGVGIAALCAGKVEVAPASRPMTPKEIETAIEKTKKTPKEFIVGRDALAIYVHAKNPLTEIAIPQLAEIYGEDGKINRWEDLGVKNEACADGEIIRVSRQNSSGTYAYFREMVLGKREYKQGATAQSGSAELITLISKTPCSIGYSGMGFRKDDVVKVLKVSKESGEPAVEPTVASAQDGSYPISRPLYLYTLGEPAGAVQEFIQWVMSPEGQQIVEQEGYVPNTK